MFNFNYLSFVSRMHILQYFTVVQVCGANFEWRSSGLVAYSAPVSLYDRVTSVTITSQYVEVALWHWYTSSLLLPLWHFTQIFSELKLQVTKAITGGRMCFLWLDLDIYGSKNKGDWGYLHGHSPSEICGGHVPRFLFGYDTPLTYPIATCHTNFESKSRLLTNTTKHAV